MKVTIDHVGIAVSNLDDALSFYRDALGLGATKPGQIAGIPASGVGETALPVSVSIGGVPLASTDILYAGVTPSYIGLYQINLRVPQGVPSGNQVVIVTVGSNQSPAGGYLAVQ